MIFKLQGVAWDSQTVSDLITKMRIIDSKGELRMYSMEDDIDMMRAVQCNLGLWGIIVDFTLKVIPISIFMMNIDQPSFLEFYYEMFLILDIHVND